MRNIKSYKNRHGKRYFYYVDRRTKFRRRLPDNPHSPEFHEAWTRAHAENKGATPVAARGTWAELRLAYLRSPEYLDLADRTRADYRKVLDYLEPMDAVRVEDINTASLVAMRNKIGEARNWRHANYCLAVISRVFSVTKLSGLVENNPALGVPKLKRPKGKTANRPWTDGELDAMLEAANPTMRAAIALAAYTGLRQGDVLAFSWPAREAGYIRQGKTDEIVWVPEHSRLTAILDALPKVATVVVTNAAGKPYTSDGFRTVFGALKSRLEDAGKVGKGLTFHGLRHTVATRLADAGADNETIAAVTGHKSEAMVKKYTENRDKKARAKAAIKLIDGGIS